MHSRLRTFAFLALGALCASPLHAQSTQLTDAPPAAVDRLFRIGGVVPSAPGTAAGGVETIAFAIYDSETGGTVLWQELQTVSVDSQGRYSVLLGSTNTDGLPLELFATGEPRWLATRVQREGMAEQPRSLLTSVPYALRAAKASDADTLGGRPASDYQLAGTSVAGGGSARGEGSAVDGGAAISRGAIGPLTAGTVGRIGKFVTAVDLGDSVMFESASRIGIGTTSPLDVLHARFTDAGGGITGVAVQNLSGAANAYSGMLFYDNTGALGQFQGFNNSTKEYRINNIASGGSINFMLNATSRFIVANGGNVGISNATPGYKLDVEHGGATGIRVKSTSSFSTVDIDGFSGDSALRFYNNGSSRWNIRNRPGDDYLEFFELGGGGSRMVIQDGTGYVGIGGTPTVPLEVFGTQGGIATTGASAFFNASSTVLGTANNNTYSIVSIRAEGQVLASIFAAVSDARIKNIKGRSNGAGDLRTLRDIEVTDYLYKDVTTKGGRPQKKVVAQQVEQVFPQAVSQTTDVVPDIYQKAALKDGWIQLVTDLKVGDRVRLLTETGHRAVHEVREVENGRFRTDFVEDAAEVFVYGREVKDFRVVDYEAIAMLNVSATQELSRTLEQQASTSAAQASEIAALTQQLAELRAALTAAIEAAGMAAARVPQDR